jgi:hypothetical protein
MEARMTNPPEDRLSEVLGEASRRRQEAKSLRRDRHFIKGPLPMRWIVRAARLPGKAVQVGLALWFMRGMVGNEPIKLSTDLLGRFNVGRKAAYRALARLEGDGLIWAERGPGRLPRVSIIVQIPSN